MLRASAITLVLLAPTSSNSEITRARTERSAEKSLGVSAQEAEQVRRMLADRRDAFNRHDVKTGCAYFAENADFVNVAGAWWKGRQEIEKQMTELYATMFKNIRFNDSETSIRFITPELAVAHTQWEATRIV